MNVISFLGAVLFGVGINEFCDISPWAARKIVRWSACRKYTDPERAEIRSEELAALIDDRPGKTLKLLTAFGYVGAAIADIAWRRVSYLIPRSTGRAQHRTHLIPDRASPKRLDTTVPNEARMYDYGLGGKDNYLADREAAERLRDLMPTTLIAVQENRRFMRRAVRHLLAAGVRQFIDIGCGLPGRKNVHDIVYGHDPLAAVVYVDNDPVIVNHYRALLSSTSAAAVLLADARQPQEIVGNPSVTDLIDFGRPVGVLMCALLHYIDDENNPAGIVGAFTSAMAPGSHLVLSHYNAAGLSPEEQAITAEIAENMGITMARRSREQIEGMFGELQLLAPGLVPPTLWRPDPDRPHYEPTGWLLAGVGAKRHS